MTQDDDIVSSTNSAQPVLPSEGTSENVGGSEMMSGTGNDELIQLQKEVQSLKEQLARAQADYSNYVRRSKDELAQVSEWSENALLVKILPILDNLERSLSHLPEEFKSHTWTEGLGATIKLLQKTLNDLGIEKIEGVGKEVDHDLHDVISQIPHETTLIQTEVESGYLRNKKAIRHAKVIVGDGTLQTKDDLASRSSIPRSLRLEEQAGGTTKNE